MYITIPDRTSTTNLTTFASQYKTWNTKPHLPFQAQSLYHILVVLWKLWGEKEHRRISPNYKGNLKFHRFWFWSWASEAWGWNSTPSLLGTYIHYSLEFYTVGWRHFIGWCFTRRHGMEVSTYVEIKEYLRSRGFVTAGILCPLFWRAYQCFIYPFWSKVWGQRHCIKSIWLYITI